MKRTHFLALICTVSLGLSVSWAKTKKRGAPAKTSVKTPYPRVQNILGPVYLISDAITVENRSAQIQEREKLLKKGEILKDKAHFRAGDKAEVELQLSAGSRITVLENSEINIPGISWDQGAIFQINLISGKMRISCTQDCHRRFSSALFDAVLPPGDFVLSYEPKIPSVSLQVLEGQAPFRGLGNENELDLKEGEMATFTGILQEGSPALDILLKGRKVAKGQTSEVQKIPVDELLAWRGRDELVKRKMKSAAQARAPKRTPSQICEKPYAELGQCAWVCENNPKKAKDCAVQNGATCVRTRCDANGSWSDRSELSITQSRCGIKTVVEACDY